MQTIKYGCTGETVKTLQTALNRAGCNLTVDGIFGSKTVTAVKIFQKQYGLTADGIVGEKTWAKLDSFRVDLEAFGTAVRACLADIEKLDSFEKLLELM